jgi:hypothetical protein
MNEKPQRKRITVYFHDETIKSWVVDRDTPVTIVEDVVQIHVVDVRKVTIPLRSIKYFEAEIVK